MDSEEEEAVYCICRSTDVSRFMVGCDHCEEWYHGDCINVTARETKYIKKFFCNECREKNPSLSIVYKSKYADKIQEIAKQKEREERERKILRENREKLGEKEEEKPKPKVPSIPKIPKNRESNSSKKSESSSKSRDDKGDVRVKSEHKERTKDVRVKEEPKEKFKDIKSRDEHKEKIKEVKVKDEPKEIKVKDEWRDKAKEDRKKEDKKHKHKHKEKEKDKDDKEEKKHKHKHKHKEKEKDKDNEKDDKEKKKNKHKKASDEIEEDELAWLQSENTNLDGVKRIPKEFKEPSEKDKLKEESRKDYEKEKQKEKEKEREKKQKEEIEKERKRNMELVIEKKKQLQKEAKEKAREEKRKEAELKKKAETIDNRERSISTDSHSKSHDSPHSEITRSPAAALPKRPPLTERQQIKEIENIDETWQPSSSKPAKAPSKRKDRNEGSKDGSHGGSRPKKRRRDWRDLGESSSEDEAGPEMDLKPRQCYGPQCTKCARVGSKYCSEQCGLSLASHRIYQTLPDRIREWNMKPCKAEENNRKELERIRAELQEVRQRLEDRNREVDMLEAIIAKGRSLSVIEKDDSDDDEDEVRMGAIDCITCGKEVPVRTAIKHMESCFNKFESQTSFGSMYKTKIEGYQMFCDFYNQQSGTYCKRLRVICPEHTIDEKISDTAVCGFPLTKDVFSITGEFCRVAKKECNAHYCWEKLRRAELDMDRVRQWLKIDDLFEQERQEKDIISRRAGVLGLLLHSTFNHVVLDERMKAQRMQQQQQQMQMLQQQQEIRRQQVTGGNKSLAATTKL